MSEPKRPLKVFLCHAHADRDSVRGLYARLTKDGVDAWLDKEKLLPGQDWELEIRKAVREADVVVVCLSKQFNQAGFRQKEVRLALDTAMEQPEGEIFIVPARLEECDTLESLRKWHWVDLYEENGYEMLMRALRARADRIGATLQIKKNWLPKITSLGTNTLKPVVEKISVISTKDVSEESLNREKIERKNAERNAREKEENEAAEKVSQERVEKEIQRRLEKSIKKAKRDIWWGNLKRNIRYRLRLIWVYRVPILILLVTFGLVVPLLIRLSNLIPNITSTVVFTPTIYAGSLPTEITDDKKMQMVLVPTGPFVMGNTADKALAECKKITAQVYCEIGQFISEEPPHQVTLGNYYMDIYEVTIASYKACVDAGVCTIPFPNTSITRSSYYNDTQYANFPVINVSWFEAKTYCETWRGARLPTEAEWEKAARSTDGRTYPWGEGIDCNKSNFCNSDTTAVGSYKSDKSPYGIYDMAGNVWEWVADWFDGYPGGMSGLQYYGTTWRVVRGGWLQPNATTQAGEGVRSSSRSGYLPGYGAYNIGFRCVRDATP